MKKKKAPTAAKDQGRGGGIRRERPLGGRGLISLNKRRDFGQRIANATKWSAPELLKKKEKVPREKAVPGRFRQRKTGKKRSMPGKEE